LPGHGDSSLNVLGKEKHVRLSLPEDYRCRHAPASRFLLQHSKEFMKSGAAFLVLFLT